MIGYFNNNGSDSAAGTASAPWKTLAKLQSAILAGTITTGLLAGGQTFTVSASSVGDSELNFSGVSNFTIS